MSFDLISDFFREHFNLAMIGCDIAVTPKTQYPGSSFDAIPVKPSRSFVYLEVRGYLFDPKLPLVSVYGTLSVSHTAITIDFSSGSMLTLKIVFCPDEGEESIVLAKLLGVV